MTALPATPCPPWCRVGVDHQPGDRYHFSEFDWTGPIGLCVEITQDEDPVIAVSLGADPLHLDLAGLDAFIARLNAKRPFLAEITGSVA